MTSNGSIPAATRDMTSAKPQRHHQRMLWALGFGGFLVNADNRAISPMLPAIAMALHTSASMAGLLVTAYSIPYGLFQLVYGPIADRIGKVTTILVSLCLFALGTIACGLVHTFFWLIILRVMTGIFAAGIIPTTLAQIGDKFDLAARPRAIAFFMSLSTTGQALGIVIGGLFAQFVSYRILFLMLGAAAVPALFAMRRERKFEQHVRSISQISLRARYRVLFGQGKAWIVYGLVFCEGLVFYGGFTFLGVYGVTALHLSYLVIGMLTATYSLGAFMGSRTITRVLHRIGPFRMPVLGAGIMTLGYSMVWGWESVIALTAGFIVLGIGFSHCHSTLQTFATDLLPSGRATAVSVFAFSLFLGSGIGPMLAGQIMDSYGFRAMLGSLAVAMGGFSLLCLVLLRKRRMAGQAGTFGREDVE